MQQTFVVEAVIAAILFILSALFYGFTPWHTTLAGRLLFVVLLNFAFVLGLVVAPVFIDLPHRDWSLLLIFTLTMINSIIIFASVIVGQFNSVRKERDG